AGALGDLFLVPDGSDEPEQGDEHHWAREDDSVVAARAEERRIGFDRGAEEAFARQEHDYVVGRAVELIPIALGAQLLDVLADVTRIRGYVGRLLVLGGGRRVEQRLER